MVFVPECLRSSTSPAVRVPHLQPEAIFFLNSRHVEQLVSNIRLCVLGPFKCYVTGFFGKFYPHRSPRNSNNVETYTFVTLFSGKFDTPHPHLCFVILEWPLSPVKITYHTLQNRQSVDNRRCTPGSAKGSTST